MAVTVEVFHEANEWHVRREGETNTLSSHATKETAVDAGREVARREGAELVIKNLDGTIAEKDSHGNDPRDIPG